MRKIIFLVIASFLITFLALNSLSFQPQTAEKTYIATGKHVKQLYPFAGGASCCDCATVHYGKLPSDFALSNIGSVTFYLKGSRANSNFQRVKSGPTKLKLNLGNKSVVAASEIVSPGTSLPVKVPWIITFNFDPPVQVGPGTAWRLEDGDNNLESAVLLHSSDVDQKGLPGIDEQSGCQYNHKVNSWYSVKFDSLLETVPPITSGIQIEEIDDKEFIVKLNGKKIYETYAFYLKIDKSYQDLDGYNVEVLSETSGGNICEAFKNQIIRWRPDGTYSISERFGNCQGPKIQQIDQKLYFSYDSYVGRISQNTHPAQIWEYANGTLKLIPGPIPGPKPGPKPEPVPAPFKLSLQTPKYGTTLPQGNNPSAHFGFVWEFKWEISSSLARIYKHQIRITHPEFENPLLDAETLDETFIFRSNTPINNNRLEDWSWQVRTNYGENEWSEWSEVGKFSVAFLDISPPSAPQLTAPVHNTTLLQLNGSDSSCQDGFEWQFQWQPAQDEDGGIAKYKIIIKQQNQPDPIVEDILSDTTYTYMGCSPVDDSKLDGWSWQVQAQDESGNWGLLSDEWDFDVESILPASPELISPGTDSIMTRGNNPECGAGVEWKFDWQDVTHSNGIQGYQIKISRPGPRGTVVMADEFVTDSEFIFNFCKPLDDNYLSIWKWGVKAQNNAGHWNEKWVGDMFSVALAPPAPILIAPAKGEELPQENVPDSPGGFIWNFEWEPVRLSLGRARYHLIIKHQDSDAALFDGRMEDNKFEFESPIPIADNFDNWIWMVRTFDEDRNHSDWSTGEFKVAAYYAPASITGSVTDPSGNNLKDVSVVETTSGASILTDKNGSYSLTGFRAEDTIKLTFRKTGYVNRTETYTLVADINTVPVSLEFDETTISGSVFDADGSSIEQVIVNIEGTTTSDTTDSRGSYSFLDLTPNSQIKLTFSHNTYETKTKDVTLVPGQNTIEENLTMMTTSTINGKVTDTSEFAISGVAVAVNGTTTSTTTENDGSFTITGLTPDAQIVLKFKSNRYYNQTESFTPTLGKNTFTVSLTRAPLGVVYGKDHPEIILKLSNNKEYKVVGAWKNYVNNWKLTVMEAYISSDYWGGEKELIVKGNTNCPFGSIKLYKKNWFSWKLLGTIPSPGIRTEPNSYGTGVFTLTSADY